MGLGAIAVRVLFAYVFLLLMTRLSGKRTIGQASPVDLLMALIVGDLIDDLLWAEVPAAQFVVAAGVLFLAHVAVGTGTSRSPALARLIQGQPTPVVRGGAVQPAGLVKERIPRTDVMALLRRQGIEDVREVEQGTLEESGGLGLMEREWAKEAQAKDRERVRRAAQGGDE
jgi:uncharacterized membrane protein YcaP (DUF421 family)